VDEDDGGWIKGPPGVGSGWMGKFPIPHMYFNCRFKNSASFSPPIIILFLPHNIYMHIVDGEVVV
jgi:hypothetical protein